MSTKCVKVPQIMQMEALECGAAALAMVLAYHGKWIPLEQVRGDCGISRDGSNAKNIVLAARAYGLEASGLRMEVEQLEGIPLPAIIHWNFNHFVVLDGFSKGKAILNDPARGIVQVSMEEFSRSFTGIALQFKPTEAFVKGGKPRSILAFARSRIEGMILPFIFIVLIGLIMAIIGIVNPVFSRVFVDRILSGGQTEWLYPLLGAMVAVAIIQFTVGILQNVYLLKIEGKFAITANAEFLWHVLRLPMVFFTQRMAGDIAGRQRSNQSIAATLLSMLAPQILNMAMLVFYLLIMLRYNVILTLVGVTAVLINLYVANVISKKRIAITRVQARDESKLIGATLTGIDMIETLKAAGAENGFFQTWSGYQASANKAAVRFARTNQYLGVVPGAMQKLSEITVLGFGVYLIMQGQFTVGMLLAFQGFLSAFMRPVNAVVEAGQGIQEMRTAMERIEDVLKYPADIKPEKPSLDVEYKKIKGHLVMKGVTFGYSPLAAPLITGFDLDLKPGASVAFVGSSGCGKSTLAKLISGLYKPWSGEISFDGIPIGEIPRPVLTGSLAVVDQDITVFGDTISNNIKMWDESIEDFEMILAAKDAQIHEDVMAREDGYQYRMMEDGKDFSGGQRQRFEIARLLAQDPTVIILDEATSALDAKTEYEVVKAIKNRDITCVFIAHRLSTIRDCDEIIVMDKGKVVERGRHEDLIKQSGLYTRLVTTE
jgi:NHLM bacteriocin system ABC transporter peptidase/ATP-binding protein